MVKMAVRFRWELKLKNSIRVIMVSSAASFFINASDGVQMRSLFTSTQKKNNKKSRYVMNQKDNIVDSLRFCPFF